MDFSLQTVGKLVAQSGARAITPWFLCTAHYCLIPLGALSLEGCQPSSTDTADTERLPRIANTAEISTVLDLTILFPKEPSTESALIQVAENSLTVTQAMAQDIPGATLLYRLQDGEDMDKFVMDETTGVVSFITIPDWEQPQDADQNNNYEILWQVISSSGKMQSQFLVIQVTDLPE